MISAVLGENDMDIESNKEKVIKLLESTNRKDIDKLICKLKQTDFFTAPASTRFHLNVEGGLVQHSINLYKSLKALADIFKINVKDESIIITGLLHDLCKVGLYIPSSAGYQYNSKTPDGHGSLSVNRIKHFIDITEQEEMMIRWHMNHFDKDFDIKKDWLEKTYPEVFMIFFADYISTLFLEG